MSILVIVAFFVNDVQAMNWDSPLHRSIELGDQEAFDKLLTDPSTDINRYDTEGYTPLHIAVLHNRIYCIDRLGKDDRIALDKEDLLKRNVLECAIYKYDEYRDRKNYEWVAKRDRDNKEYYQWVAKDVEPIIIVIKKLIELIQYKKCIHNHLYEMFSLKKSCNVKCLASIKTRNIKYEYEDGIIEDLISIGTSFDKIPYIADKSLVSLINTRYSCRTEPFNAVFIAKKRKYESINDLLLQAGHPVHIRFDRDGKYDKDGLLLIEQAVKNNCQHLLRKLLDYGSPLPTNIDIKTCLSLIKKELKESDKERLSETKNRLMIANTAYFTKNGSLGKRGALHVLHVRQKNNRLKEQKENLL